MVNVVYHERMITQKIKFMKRMSVTPEPTTKATTN